ncbi:TPM domain-containing protein [Niastella sp. OAS944]|uniref:TPM domain-containing protein n=1 Tax=Niastella sp. OAS944 TaxID=2664089 RepID=UPI003484B147|nr:uncharacterized protein [Chitinophagaceae bacterium OAS944]
MNRFLLFVAVFLLNIVSFAQEKRSTFIKDQPLPAQLVNDFGKFLTKVENVNLERELRSFRDRKGYSVVVITLPGLTDNKGTEFTIEETAQLYFNKWGIGDNVKNDGVLILLSKQPRRIRIHTGSGMASLLTNANCASIINHTMVPNFKADLYFTGLKDAVKDIESHIDDNEAANKAQDVANMSAGQTQPAYTSEGVAQPREEMTFAKFMYGFIPLVTLAWLYFRYRLKKAALGRPGVYSGNGYNSDGVVVNNINRISNNNWGSGNGGSNRRRSWFNFGSSGSSSWFSGSKSSSSGSSGSSNSGSSSSSSGGASGSYGGGSSSGGGASGSW